MLFDSIIYYGDPGFEANVFETYMGRLGYHVRVVPTQNDAVTLLKLNPSAVAVIAVPDLKQAVHEFVRALEAESLPIKNKVFVLDDSDVNQDGLPNITIIHQPNRLSRVIHAIQSLNRRYPQA